MTVYAVDLELRFLIDERNEYKPDLEYILKDILDALSGRNGMTINRDVKVTECHISSTKM